MDSDPKKVYPVRLTDLWLHRSDGHADVLGDSELYLNHYRLDEIASFLWERCDGDSSVWEISKEVERECDSTAPSFSKILDDVWELLYDLRHKKLLTWSNIPECDVLLVAPPFPTTYHHNALQAPEYLTPPMGLAYLAAYLREHGIKVAIRDLHVYSDGPERIVKECKQLQPRLIGITATTPTYPNAINVARYVKAWSSEVPVVLGGVHATGMPVESMAEAVFDYVVIGEGEATLLGLAKFILSGGGPKIDDIAGIARRDAYGNVIINNAREPLPDLDNLPFPARDLIELDKYVKKGAICTSRGCPNRCSFCACHLIFGPHYRVPSVVRVIEELEHLKNDFGIKEIDFNDDTFNWQPGRVFDLCQAMLERSFNLRWSCFCRASEMSDEMAKAMKKAGCDAIQYGVESGSPQILNSIGKKSSLQQAEKAVKAASMAGIKEIVCGIMIGHPGDTAETIRDTYNFAEHLLKHGATRIMLSLLTPYPGTQVFKKSKDLGITILTNDWEQYIFSRLVIETKHLSKSLLRELYVEGLLRFLEYERSVKSEKMNREYS